MAFGPGPDGRPNAACRTCGSLERHRFLSLVLEAVADLVPASGAVLDVARSTQLSSQVKRLAPERYLSADLRPSADGRQTDVAVSVDDPPLPAASTAFLVCHDVLELLPDDTQAMREIARVLAPGGLALVHVPYRKVQCDEEDSESAEERIRHASQADYGRSWGDAFGSRLRGAGLVVSEYVLEDLLPDDLVTVLAGQGWDRAWICTAVGSRLPHPESVKGGVVLALASAIADAIEATTGVVTTGPVGFGPGGLTGIEAELAERDRELGLLAMLNRFRADRAEAVAVAAGAAPSNLGRLRPAWQRRLARALPVELRQRLRSRLTR